MAVNIETYLKISEGCNRTCAFCAIPLMRGGYASRPIDDLEREAETLVQKGVKEIMLIAQELTYYGLDLYKKRALPDLLKRLSDVKGIEWIRLHYAFPAGFPLEILDVMNERKNICKYLDMPLQHITDRMLKSMKRGTTKQKTIDLVNEIRDKVPGIAIRTTLIAGYPGETEKDFAEMKECEAPESNRTVAKLDSMGNIPRITSGSFWASSAVMWCTFPSSWFW